MTSTGALRRVPWLVLALAAVANAGAQTQPRTLLDSLETQYRNATAPLDRLHAAIALCNIDLNSDPERSTDLGARVLDLSDSLQQVGMLSANEARDIAMSTLQTMSIAYGHLGDFDAQMRYAMQKLALAQKAGDRAKEGSALEVIGAIYQYQGHRAEALTYYRRALAIMQEIGDTYHLALDLGNTGSMVGEHDPDSALWYYRRSMDAMRRPDMRDRDGAMGWMLNNIGSYFEERGMKDSAMYYYEQSLAIRRSADHRLGQYLVHHDIAGLLLKEGHTQEALAHADTSIRIAEDNGYHEGLDDSYLLRSKALASLGRYAEAYRDHLRYVQERDTIVSERNTKQLVQQTMRYEYGRKLLADSMAFEKQKAIQALDNALAQEKLRRTRNIYLFGGLGLLLAAGALWGRLRYTRRAKAAIEKEKERSEELLLNILPEEVAEELKEKGEAEAKMMDQVTVLFTDFKGFTAMSEQLSPRELVKDIHECFSAFDRIIERHGIEKIKTIGDAYMAAGGLPVPNTTHALDVIRAALEMRDFIAQGKARKIALGKPYFEIRIGVHSGPVVAGIVGVKKFQYDIWGDTVNTASRMESSGEAGQVNISEATYALVKDEPGLAFTSRGKVQAKGKGALAMYFVGRSSEPA